MKAEIEARLVANLRRVASLMELYTASTTDQNKRKAFQTDLLRSATVLLHATLEDVVRSVLEWQLPLVKDNKRFEDIKLVGVKTPKFTLANIAAHRSKSVDEVIKASVIEHLKLATYNSPGDIGNAIAAIGLSSKTLLDPYRSLLGPMIQRRHWIVHRADRKMNTTSGQHPTLRIVKSSVQEWYDAVKDFCEELLAACVKKVSKDA